MRNTIQFDFLHPMTTANGILSKRVLSTSSVGQWEHWLFPVLFWESQEPPWQITGLGSIILLTLGYLFNNIWFLGVTLLTYAEYWYSNIFLHFYVFLIIIPCIPSIFLWLSHPSLVYVNPSCPWKSLLNAVKVAKLLFIIWSFLVLRV